jgi:hypothetical protein
MTDDLLRLLAYVDHPGAREALPALPPMHSSEALSTLPGHVWLAGALPLYEAVCTVECDDCIVGVREELCTAQDCHPEPHAVIYPCSCKSGRAPDPHALLRLAVAVGWAVLSGWRNPCVGTPSSRVFAQRQNEQRKAARETLRAAEAYLADPSESNLAAWGEAVQRSDKPWLPRPHDRDPELAKATLSAALPLIGRQALARVVVETTTKTCDGYHGEHMDPQVCKCCKNTGRVAR